MKIGESSHSKASSENTELPPSSQNTEIPPSSINTEILPSSHTTYGVLITGGRSTEDLSATDHSAEIFLPHSPNNSCILPELPAPYFGHTQSAGGLLCGGYRPQTNDSCRQWNSTEGKFLEEPVHKISPGTFTTTYLTDRRMS